MIGATIWKFDVNRRRYDANRRCIYREHFEPHTVVGETPQSWLVMEYGRETRVNKRTMASAGRNGYGGNQWFTSETMEDNVWSNDNRLKIVEAVRYAPVPELRRIAEILGLRFAEPASTPQNEPLYDGEPGRTRTCNQTVMSLAGDG